MIKKQQQYGDTLIQIQKYCRKQRRGKKHAYKGVMYAYGYRSERKTSGFGEYMAPLPIKKKVITSEEKKQYKKQLDDIVIHITEIFKYYLPQQAQQAFNTKNYFHAHSIANTHAGNFTITHSFQSIPHTDLDATFAIGIWLDYGKGVVKGGEFTFPDFRVAIKLRNMIYIAWNSYFAKHATIASICHKSTRIGTSIQLS